MYNKFKINCHRPITSPNIYIHFPRNKLSIKKYPTFNIPEEREKRRGANIYLLINFYWKEEEEEKNRYRFFKPTKPPENKNPLQSS